MRVKGTVKFFNADRGFGFIKRDDGEDDEVFLHVTQLNASKVRDVTEGDKLTFEVEKTPKGNRAVKA